MAAFIIFGIAAVGLLRYIHVTIARDPSRADIWVRRWALYLTLFIAGLTMLGDLVALLNAFLSGSDLTTSFLLKVAVILLLAAGVFMHFPRRRMGLLGRAAKARKLGHGSRRARGHLHDSGRLLYHRHAVAGEAVPARRAARERSPEPQSEILSFYQQKQALPSALSQLQDPTLNYSVPADPATGAQYEYTKTADLGFELCATFGADNQSALPMSPSR